MAAAPASRPQIVDFEPNIDFSPQNFSIATDDNAYVFVGSTDGVLIFDGNDWQLVQVSNKDIVRSLEFDGSDRIYVGGYDAFGFLEEDATGQFQYTELSGLYSESLGDDLYADIWHIYATPDVVYFVALEHLFRYEPATGETSMWFHDGRFGPVTEFQDNIYVQFRQDALRVYDDGNWQAVSGTEIFEERITALVPHGDELLILPGQDNWFTFDGTSLAPMPTSFVENGLVNDALMLDAKTLAMMSQLGDVYFYDLETAQTETVRIANSFLASAVKGASNDLLVVSDSGFHAVKWPTAWRSIDHTQGLTGSVHGVTTHGNEIWVLSSGGAFYANAQSRRFDRLDWTSNEAWDLLRLDDGSFLLAESYNTYAIDDSGMTAVGSEASTPRVLYQSPFDPKRIYIGTELGIEVLERNDDGWQLVYHKKDMRNLRITTFVETAPGELLVGSDRGGVQRLTITPGDTWTMEARSYTEADGIRYGDISDSAYLYRIDGKLIATNETGFYRLEDDRFVSDDLFGLEQLRHPGQFLDLAAEDHQIWAIDYNRVLRFDEGQWLEEDVSGLRSGGLSYAYFANERVIISDEAALLVFSDQPESPPADPLPVTVTSAEQESGDGEPVRLALNDLRLSRGNDRVKLQYALPDFRRPDSVRYRTRLLPTETDYSNWTVNNQITFATLGPGEYTFQVQARDSLGRISSTESTLVVEPRWYETPAMKAVWGLLLLTQLVLMMVAASRYRSRQLTLERDRLEEMVHERTRALESANKQLEQMAHLDGLTQIPNRRKLDEYLDDVWAQCVERGRVMAIGIIDVDLFKNYNDTHGHLAGDELLVHLAGLLSRNLRRAEDLVARYGGEEFLVVMPGAERATAIDVVEQMRRNVEHSDLGVTISAGVYATVPDSVNSITDIIAAADAALYEAKESGRNRVEVGLI